MSANIEQKTEGAKEIALREASGQLVLSKETVDNYMANMELLSSKFKDWLKPDIDYTTKLFSKGRAHKPTLLDPGASKLIGFFRTRARHRVLEHFHEEKEGEESIRYVVAAEIVTQTGDLVVGEGVGSCSSEEVKYQYRWFFQSELEDMGFEKAQIETLPKREIDTVRGKAFMYKIRNPEIPDLDNTILKMAAKRSEVDGALQLPGVGEVFTQDIGSRLKQPVKEEPKHVQSEVTTPAEKKPPVPPPQKPSVEEKPLAGYGSGVSEELPPIGEGEPLEAQEGTMSIDYIKGALEQAGCDSSLVEVTEEANGFVVKPYRFLGDVWGGFNDSLKEIGATWIRAGRESRWELSPIPEG